MIEYSNTQILEYSCASASVSCASVSCASVSCASVSCASVSCASVLSRVGRLISRLLVGNWLILCVGRHSKSFKGGGNWLRFFFFAICLASYYPLAVFYNAPMLKYPSHHLIYIFYHPMPIMPLY